MKAIVINTGRFVDVTCIGERALISCTDESYKIYADSKDGTLYREKDLSFIEGVPDWQAYRMKVAKDILTALAYTKPEFMGKEYGYAQLAVKVADDLISLLKNDKQ